MASFITLTFVVFSSKESLSTGRMGFQKLPAISITKSGSVGFLSCFKVKAMQKAFASAEGISVCSLMKMKNSLYEVLEISPAATAEDVKMATAEKMVGQARATSRNLDYLTLTYGFNDTAVAMKQHVTTVEVLEKQ